ncbi:MAG: hypothetical protein U0103_24175 [Candidatus Obscuribacterales bacterium]
MNKNSLAPLRWLIAPFGATAAFVASQELFSIIAGLIKPTLIPSLAMWAVSDWCSTAFAMYTAVEIAPRKKGMVALVAAVALSLWHCALMVLAPQHPISASYSHETIWITCLGGFAIAAILAARFIRNEQFDIPGDELVEVVMKQLAESRLQMEADSMDDAMLDHESFSEVSEKPTYKTDRDMILLERELRYVNLPRTAYISAIRFAIAVERDAALQNCKGELLFFHQIVLDSAMRLSVMKNSESFWKTIAHQFRAYENLTEEERRSLVNRTEALLPIEREPEAEPAESELIAEQMLLEVTTELGLEVEPELQYAMNT